MSRKDEVVQKALAELETMDVPALQQKWEELYGLPAPRRMRSAFLIRACAYRIQEQAFGGLKASTLKQIEAVLADLRAGKAVMVRPKRTLSPGVRLVREWGGATHHVEVLEQGYQWQGRTYRSLSVIAREITSARWSGPRFFGLNAKAS